MSTKRRKIISEDKDAKVIRLEPRLGDEDTVTVNGKTKTVDDFVVDKRAKDLGDETVALNEVIKQEMGRDRRKSTKLLGNLYGKKYSHPFYTTEDGFNKSGYVKHLKGDDMEEVDENGLTPSVKDIRHKTASARTAFEKDSRDIWNVTSNIKGQTRTSAGQFMIWVMLFTHQIVMTKTQWIARFEEVLKKWNHGKSPSVSFTQLQSSTTYTVMKTMLDKSYPIYALIYRPEKSATIAVFGFHPSTLFIRREHLQIMMLKSKKEEGWKLLKRYCTEGDPLYSKDVAAWVERKLKKVESETLEQDLDITDVQDNGNEPIYQNVISEIVKAIRDNTDDASLGKMVKQSAVPLGNLISMLFAGVKASGEIDINIKLKI